MNGEQERYLGSVKFFKNLIFIAVLILIIVPTVLAICNGRNASRQASRAETLEQERQQLEQELARKDAETVPQTQAQPSWVPDEEEPGYTEDAPYYESLYPDFYAPQPLNAETRAEDTIYLTFDDGPSERTLEILDALDREGVKATFFVVGRNDEISQERMREIVDRGHTIAMHSYSHSYTQIYRSVEDFLDDMYRLFTLIVEATGTVPTAFRFPGGSVNAYNTGINQQIISEMLRRGFTPFDWNLSAQDATNTPLSPAQIVENAMTGAERVSRGVVLMHDSAARSTTVEALPTLIARYRELGFTFDRIRPDTKPVLYSYRNYEK